MNKQVETIKKNVVKYKTEILAGAVVILAVKNRSLKKENLELVSKLDEAHTLLGQGGALLKDAADYIEAKSVFDQVFGNPSSFIKG